MPGGVWISPWSTTYRDYQNRGVMVSIPFDPNTLAIINPGLTGFRDEGCLFDRLLIGRPDGTMRVFLIPEGAFGVSRQQLAQRGFNTIENVTNANITVGNQETPN